MLIVGILFVLVLLTAVHWYLDSRDKSVFTKVPKATVLSWSAISIVVGLSAGSLSLSTFPMASVENSALDIIKFLSAYGVVLLTFLVVSLILVFRLRKEED